MSAPPTADLAALLEALTLGGVEIVIVGGVAAVLQGAPVTTHDLDVVYQTTPANLDRLDAALTSLDAEIRDLTGRHLRPTRSLLERAGQLQLLTRLGPLDCLGRLHDGRGYDQLVDRTDLVSDGALTLRVLDLPTLIEIKRDAGRAKDRLVLPILVALLARRES